MEDRFFVILSMENCSAFYWVSVQTLGSNNYALNNSYKFNSNYYSSIHYSDGPCSLNLSRMRSIDTSLISPGPSEIINRYSRWVEPHIDRKDKMLLYCCCYYCCCYYCYYCNRVLPTSSIGYSTYQQVHVLALLHVQWNLSILIKTPY